MLLISLLLPVMSKAVDAAREKQCMSGLKEVGSAFAAYEGDNNGCIPKCSTAAYCGVNYGPFLTWGATLIQGGYLPHGATWYPNDTSKYPLYRTNAFYCPCDPRIGTCDMGIANDEFMPIVQPDYDAYPCTSDNFTGDLNQPYSHALSTGVMDLCYYWSYCQSTDDWPPRTVRPAQIPHMRINKIADPAGTMLVIEGLGTWWYAWYDDEWTGAPGRRKPAVEPLPTRPRAMSGGTTAGRRS